MNEIHSKQYEKYAERYRRGGCTDEQLRKLAELNVITTNEFIEITGLMESND